MWCAPGLSSGSATGQRLVVKLIVVGPGREVEAGYRGIRHAPVAVLAASCVTHPMAQITGRHGNARHG
jgi:hypothetical protein